jgi:hypothetical protein
MRTLLIATAMSALATASAATPAAAQRAAETLRGAADAIEETAPMIDRSADALLDLDVGPLLDAADPYGRRGRHRTLREIARRDDPYFDRRMRASIYGTAAGLSRMMDGLAAAEPALRRSVREMEDAIGAAVENVPRRMRPGRADEDWHPDLDEEDFGDEPY